MEHFYQSIRGWFDFEALYAALVGRAPLNAHFVEVGAFEGKSTSFMAVEIINSGKNIRFDVVDTWEGSIEHQQGASHQSDSVVSHTLFETFTRNMLPVEKFINPIRLPSLEAAKLYPDRSLDLVFIDASHEYEDVKADILAWRPKIKPGGFMGGHDFQEFFPGVIRAVKETVPYFEVVHFSWVSKIPNSE